jgi:UDPglucose 6-dehydrogenase
MSLSVIGLGRLGLPFSFFLGSRGYRVYGYDNDDRLKNIIQNNVKSLEPNLNNYIKKYRKNFFYEKTLKNIILKTNTTFLVLPTPSNNDGSFSNNYIKNCLEKIGVQLKSKKNENHLIVITSTVSPGSCSYFVKILVDKGLENGKDFSIIYNPHFIAQGTTIYNLENPDLLLIGSDNKKSKKKINFIYQKIYNKNNFFKNTNFLEAEIAKISINCFITTKISFSNYISEICQKFGNADAKNVLDVIGQDKRINHSYMKIGTKFSGPCFPRDNNALINYSKKIKVKYFIPKATNQINYSQSNRILNVIENILKTKKKKLRLGIFGLTYKSNTNIILDSQADNLLKKIYKKKIKFNKILVYDEFLEKHEIKKYNKYLTLVENIKEFCKNSDIILLLYPHYKDQFFKNFSPKKEKFLLDCWRRVNVVKKNFVLINFGKFNF